MVSNFEFLKHKEYNHKLSFIGERSEAYLYEDPSTSLTKIRQLAELLCEYLASRYSIYVGGQQNQIDRIRALRNENIIGQAAADILHSIRKSGNKATHAAEGDTKSALENLKLLWDFSVKVHRIVAQNKNFSPQFQIPPKPLDYEKIVQEYQARLQESEERRKQEDAIHQKELQELRKNTKVLTEEEAKAEIKDLLEESQTIEIDEATTRRIIDEQLREAGWEVDTETLRHKLGARPEEKKFKAIAEWPCKKRNGKTGFADYALFVGEQLLGLIEAKRKNIDVKSHLDQALEYAEGLEIKEGIKAVHLDENGNEKWKTVKVPFIFSTNGRAYLKQLQDKSGIWFQDVRSETNIPRALHGWHSPKSLEDLFKKSEAEAIQKLKSESKDKLPLREYQKQAIEAVEQAIIDGKREMMIAMATGTGKTRTCIGLCYRLLKSKRFKRILFLVDRTSLGTQAIDSFKDLKIEQNLSFTQIYNIKELSDVDVETSTRVHFATVQGLVKRILYSNSDKENPIPIDQYDCIIIDECHRGYTLDKELSEDEFEFRSEKDFLSKYRRVLEYFDAVKIGLTATPALHTVEIFGKPVFNYGYRQAVIDGFLIDHETPYLIKTKLSEEGIHWEKGSNLQAYDTDKQEVEDLENIPDELDFEVGDFNTKVSSEEFNRVVCEELVNRIVYDGDEKTLIFCARDTHADMVVRLLKESYQEIYGEVNDSAIKKITGNTNDPDSLIKHFKNEKYPSIGVTVDLLTTGIDVKQICNIVFLRRVKSRILYDQMIGRATRTCEEIGKEYFRIYDAVGIYKTLEKFTQMKPVVANPSIQFSELFKSFNEKQSTQTKQAISDQYVAKLNLKKTKIKGESLEKFKTIMDGQTPDEVIEEIKDVTKPKETDWLNKFQKLSLWLDQIKAKKNLMFISDHEDELLEVEQGYGDDQAPEDYISSFSEFIKNNFNELKALKLVAEKPGDLTRKELKALKHKLEENGFKETDLRTAYKKVSNKEIAATILGYIRKEAIGDPLIPYKKRVDTAVEKLKEEHDFNAPQLKWIDKIADQLKVEVIVDKEELNEGVFETLGGYKRAEKIFGGKIEEILKELQENIWLKTS